MIATAKVEENLVKADLLRILSKGFSYPAAENLSQIKEIIAEIINTVRNKEWKSLLQNLVYHLHQDEIQSEYSRLFLMKKVPLSESSCCTRLNAITDVAGFYHAFGMNPKSGDAPDALPYELEFLSLLLVKYLLAKTTEQKEITRSAYDKFLDEHVNDFTGKFSEKMHEAGCSDYYKALLVLLNSVIPGTK